MRSFPLLSQQHLIALSILLVAILWMLAGPDPVAADTPPRSLNTGPSEVLVKRLKSQAKPLITELSAVTAASRQVTLASEIKGKVTRILKERGALVRRGELLLQLDTRDWPERVEQAEAQVEEQSLALKAAEQLNQQGLSNASELARLKSNLANAKATLTNARIQLAASQITAPFSGVLNDRQVEVGDLVREGTELLDLIDVSPYLVVGQLPEHQAELVSVGQPAQARLLSGETVNGVIRYKSAVANANTRTFRIELEIENPNNQLLALGSSAHLLIPAGEADVYAISPTLLVISDAGALGVKTVSDDNRVRFTPVQMYESDATTLWVTGLEAGTRLITRGAGFVEPGELVNPVAESDQTEH